MQGRIKAANSACESRELVNHCKSLLRPARRLKKVATAHQIANPLGRPQTLPEGGRVSGNRSAVSIGSSCHLHRGQIHRERLFSTLEITDRAYLLAPDAKDLLRLTAADDGQFGGKPECGYLKLRTLCLDSQQAAASAGFGAAGG